MASFLIHRSVCGFGLFQAQFFTSTLLPHPPERRNSEPGEGQSKAGGENDAADAGLARLVLGVFAKSSGSPNCRKHKKHEAGNLQPELPQHARERNHNGLGALQDGPAEPGSLQMLARNLRSNLDLSQSGNLRHGSILAVGGRTMFLGSVTEQCDPVAGVGWRRGISWIRN